jgi:hypothetical protein
MQYLFNYVPENVLILKYQKVKKNLSGKCYLDALDTAVKKFWKDNPYIVIFKASGIKHKAKH